MAQKDGLVAVKRMVAGPGKPHITTLWVKSNDLEDVVKRDGGFAKAVEMMGGNPRAAREMQHDWWISSKNEGSFAFRQALADAGYITHEAVKADALQRSGYKEGVHGKGSPEHTAYHTLVNAHTEYVDGFKYDLAPNYPKDPNVNRLERLWLDHPAPDVKIGTPAFQAWKKADDLKEKAYRDAIEAEKQGHIEAAKPILANSAHAAAVAAQHAYSEETVTLYRGVGEAQAKQLREGNATHIAVDSLSSWTENKDIAERFARSRTFEHSATESMSADPNSKYQTRDAKGAIVTIQVPRTSIVASHRVNGTPFKTHEGEVVIANSARMAQVHNIEHMDGSVLKPNALHAVPTPPGAMTVNSTALVAQSIMDWHAKYAGASYTLTPKALAQKAAAKKFLASAQTHADMLEYEAGLDASHKLTTAKTLKQMFATSSPAPLPQSTMQKVLAHAAQVQAAHKANPPPPPPPPKPAPLALPKAAPLPKALVAPTPAPKPAAPKAKPAKASPDTSTAAGAATWLGMSLSQLEAVPPKKRDVHWLRARNNAFQAAHS